MAFHKVRLEISSLRLRLRFEAMTVDELDECHGNRTPSVKCSSLVEFVGYILFLTPVCILGVLMNLLNIVVFRSRFFQIGRCTLSLLMALSVSEFLCLALTVPLGPGRCLPVNGEWEWQARQVYEVIFVPVLNTFGAASVWLTTLLSIQRYVCIRHLSIARVHFSQNRTIGYIVVIYVIALLIHIPYFFSKPLQPIRNSQSSSAEAFRPNFHLQALQWFRLVTVKIIPLLLLACFNTLTICFLCGSGLRRNSVGPLSCAEVHRLRVQQRVTIMLITISVTFMVCQIPEPFAHPAVYATLHGLCSVYQEPYNVQVVITDNLEMLSYSFNFLFFCIFHRQFTSALKQIVGCRPPNSIDPGIGTESRYQSTSKMVFVVQVH